MRYAWIAALGLVLAALSPADAGPGSPAFSGTRASDVFLGQDKTGPYRLSWKNVLRDGVAVVMDGRVLSPDTYTLDSANGTITFKVKMRAQSIARVDYAYDPVRSQSNAAGVLTGPVTVSLVEKRGIGSSANVQVTALPGDARLSGPTAPLLVYGFSGETHLLSGGLRSRFLLGPDTGKQGSLFDRAAVSLGYGLAGGNSRLDLDFQRSGREFAAGVGKNFALGDPAQRWSLAGQSALFPWLTASLRVGGGRDLSGAGSSGQNAVSLRLLGGRAAPALDVVRSLDTRRTATGAQTAVTTEKVGLAGKAGERTSYSAQGQRVTTDAPDAAGDQKRLEASAAVSTTGRDGRSRASVAVNGATVEKAAGTEAQQGVDIKLQTSQGASVSAEARRQSVDPSGDKRASTTASDRLAVSSKVGKTASVSAQAERAVTSQPQGDQTRRDAALALSAASRNNQAQASIAVTGGTTETAGATEFRQGVEVKLKPAPALTLSAEARRQALVPEGARTATSEKVYQAANADLRPFPNSRIVGSIRMGEEPGYRWSVREVSGESKPWGFLAVAGGVTDRQDTRAGQLDTTRARLTVRPAAGWTLAGAVTINPEDKGRATDALREELELAARFGFLNLGGSYALTTLEGAAALDPRISPQYGELSVTMGMRFSRYTSLLGGYKDALYYGAALPLGVRSYSLGLSHNVGSLLNFSLAGSYTQDRAQTDRPADIKAEAKLGVRF